MEEQDQPDETSEEQFDIHLASYVFIVSSIVTGSAGIVANGIFLSRNKGYRKGRDKIGDVLLLVSILATFNIFFLIDVIPKTYYVLVGSVPINEYNYVACNLYGYYASIVKFGIFYTLTYIAIHCNVLAKNTPESNRSTRVTLLVEAVVVWSIYLLLFVVLNFHLGWFRENQECMEAHLRHYREPVLLLFIIVTGVYTLLIHLKAKPLNEAEDAPIVHILSQSKKIVLLYVACWFPLFTYNTLTIELGIRNDPGITRYLHVLINLFFIYLEYVMTAAFPFVWKLPNQIQLESHQLV